MDNFIGARGFVRYNPFEGPLVRSEHFIQAYIRTHRKIDGIIRPSQGVLVEGTPFFFFFFFFFFFLDTNTDGTWMKNTI